MSQYQILDTLADAFIPALAIFCLITLVLLVKRGWRPTATAGIVLLFGLFIAYGGMALDRLYRIFPKFGLDYSTHTAVALVLGIFLAAYNKKYWPLIYASLFGYAVLMVYQRYHSIADIVATAAAIGALYIASFWASKQYS